MNIKITGKIEKPVEINPLDVIRELKLQLLGRNDYFIGYDGKVYYRALLHPYDREYTSFPASDEIQNKVDLVRALDVLINELS
ncbi:hypothetical protein [Faecalibacillus intestinalis]|uniref:hypothetical protein n=1 Tax=Faecalibacillus intestinalis TaxID=1982626 RepID=UPI0039A2E817